MDDGTGTALLVSSKCGNGATRLMKQVLGRAVALRRKPVAGILNSSVFLVCIAKGHIVSPT